MSTTASSAPVVIPNQYIVFYTLDADRAATNERLFFSSNSSIATSDSFSVVHEMDRAIAVTGISDAQSKELAQDPFVAKVIPDYEVTIEAVQASPYSWGLDRIDQSNLPLDDTYEYTYTGTGVRAYIFDSGIRKTHEDFGGRATCGINLIATETCTDMNFHGTHVAGTVGGMISGVAKGVQLVDVKVLDKNGRGTFSGVMTGLEYVLAQKQNNPTIPMVINMSLGGKIIIPEVEDAIDDAVAAGIVVVVAAGNSAVDACEQTPAYIQSAITVGASNMDDTRADFSNFGDCVDIYAPGVDIVSAYHTGDDEYAYAAGTSMAAPHIAGVAALYLEANPTWTPAQVWNAMRDDAVEAIQRTYDPVENYFRMRRTTRLLTQTQPIS
ncbi:hypothetical protein FisN_9Lh013 [Fistulifera solaris]|uniref:subtilisin n=1 Tax=Fistulifera solaris TaxID=1519565 RepID=A0A1Z5JHD0_FISSO|nr:hypothetical protein FisN_9Lh013 [Fistulifera solaris]|eukprot:GAX13400.1 hypothetical protein FisN_9Lh013 [Fistulifera solaris]